MNASIRARAVAGAVAASLFAPGSRGADAVILWQNGFESADICAWASTQPAVSCDPEMVFVPAGEFTMGSNYSGPSCGGCADEQPIHTVDLSAFWIDRTEVTIDAYGACVSDGGCSVPEGVYDVTNTFGSPYCNWGAPWSQGQQPVNCLHWFTAYQYCAWAGKRFPTEAEWEKAARGTDARTYPWGNEIATCNYAVQWDFAAGGDGCGSMHTSPVGSKPAGASPYGALDMAGNAPEWVADWYLPAYYAESPPSNPPGPSTADLKSLRGGTWRDDASTVRASNRDRISPNTYTHYYLAGFRCARDE